MEFNKVYHTKTMVEILVKQGHMNLALKLSEQILNDQPENQAVLQLNQAIKEEIKRSFEKFKRAGQVMRAVTEVAEVADTEEILENNEIIEVNLTAEEETIIPEMDPKLLIIHKQVAMLENLLQNIQLRRQPIGTAS